MRWLMLVAVLCLAACNDRAADMRVRSAKAASSIMEKGALYRPSYTNFSLQLYWDDGTFCNHYYRNDPACGGRAIEAREALERRGHDMTKVDRWEGRGPVPTGESYVTKWCVAYHPGGDWHECWTDIEPSQRRLMLCASPGVSAADFTLDGCEEFDRAVQKMVEDNPYDDYVVPDNFSELDTGIIQDNLACLTDDCGEAEVDSIEENTP